MKRRNVFGVFPALILTVLFLVSSVFALSAPQRRRGRGVSRDNVRNLVRQVEDRADVFRKEFDHYLDRSRLDGSRTEDRLNDVVQRFERATNDLRRKSDRMAGWEEVREEVLAVVARGREVDTIMRRGQWGPNLEREWIRLRTAINELGRVYRAPEIDTRGRSSKERPYDRNRDKRQEYSRDNVRNLVRQVEDRADVFRKEFDHHLDRSRLDGSRLEDRLNDVVQRFERATNDLRRKSDRMAGWQEVREEVLSVVARGREVDNIMRQGQWGPNLEREWNRLRMAINELGRIYQAPEIGVRAYPSHGRSNRR